MPGLNSALALGSFAAYLWWAISPRLEHPELVREMLESARARQLPTEHRLSRENNAFFTPDFYQYWGETQNKSGRVARCVSAWKERPSPKTRQAFQQLSQDLRLALQKPYFALPADPLLKPQAALEIVPLTELKQALLSLSQAQLKEDSYEGAFDSIYCVLRLSQSLSQDHYVLGRPLYSSSFFRAAETLSTQIPFQELRTEHWEALATLCLPGQSLEKALHDFLEDQLFEHYNGLDVLRKSPIPRKGPLPLRLSQTLFLILLRASLIGPRQQRVVANIYSHLKTQLRSGEKLKPRKQGASAFANFSLAEEQTLHLSVMGHLRAQAAKICLGVSALLMLYAEKHGCLPGNLKALDLDFEEPRLHWNVQTQELFLENDPSLTRESGRLFSLSLPQSPNR